MWTRTDVPPRRIAEIQTGLDACPFWLLSLVAIVLIRLSKSSSIYRRSAFAFHGFNYIRKNGVIFAMPNWIFYKIFFKFPFSFGWFSQLISVSLETIWAILKQVLNLIFVLTFHKLLLLYRTFLYFSRCLLDWLFLYLRKC